MKDIFISYSHADRVVVKNIINELENIGLSIHYDSSFSAGEIWNEKALEYILDSKCAIFFISDNSIISESVLKELIEVDKESEYRSDFFYFAVLLNNNTIKKIYESLSKNSEISVAQRKIAHKIFDKFPDNKIYINNDANVVANIVDSLKKNGVFINFNLNMKKKNESIPIGNDNYIMNISDGIYENEYLLDNGVTVGYISQRHVKLDVLTVDNEKYKGAMDENVEGDEETWIEMISDTADCSVNLVINHEIVGYLDFIPVLPETYDLLREKPFTKEDVAFYSFGGKFDVYGSMFSIDINYATQKNYQKFFDWMINKIKEWEKNNIYIGRITFSIYSNNQARVLEYLGFKKVLENDLKGMLYEITKEQFFNSQIVKNKLKSSYNKKIEYKIYSSGDLKIIDSCNEIALSHNVKNGGMLHFYHIIDDVDIIICSQIEDEIIGYLGLKEYVVLESGIYLEQIAVKKGYMRQGIGSKMLETAISICKKQKYKYLYANCNKKNYPSYEMFKKYGFKEFEMDNNTYTEIGFVENDIVNNYALKYVIERIRV